MKKLSPFARVKVRGGYSLGQPTSRSAPDYPGRIYQPILKKKHHLSKWSSYSATTKHEEVFVPEKPISWWTKISKQIHIFHNFTRRGSALALVVALFSISTLPLQSLSDLSPNFFVGLLKALVPMEFTNIYMMGLNLLYDIRSDKINKPTLPLASGELSVVAGITIVAISGILGIALAVKFKSPSVLYGVLAWMFFTSVYSTDLPLLRWKQNQFLSLLCLVCIRGLTIPITVFSHVQTYVLGRPLEFTKPAIFSLVIICIFMAVGTFLKDIPDEEGDKAFGMQSLSLIFGRERRRRRIERHFMHEQEVLTAAALAIQMNLVTAAHIIENSNQPTLRIGSVPGRTYRNRNRATGNALLKADYFGVNPTYDEVLFRKRNRMSSHLFLRIRSGLKEHSDFWMKKYDAANKPGLSSHVKIMCALQMLANGSPADSMDQYFRIAQSTTLSFVKMFCKHVVERFGAQYLRSPNEEDIARLLRVAELRGFPGMLGSLDCMHWTWQACPMEWAGQYTGRHGSATLVLEAVASFDMWIWHAYFGLPGTNNDVNVLWRSNLFHKLTLGLTPPANYSLMGKDYTVGYYLADGIYPQLSTLVKAKRNPKSRRDKFFTLMQESYRKDVERAFGVLQSRFAIVRGKARLWDKDVLHDVMSACIILHNMIVEEERHNYLNAYVYGDSEPIINHDYFENPNIAEVVPDRNPNSAEFRRVLQRVAYVHNRHEHVELEQRLINHLWEWRDQN